MICRNIHRLNFLWVQNIIKEPEALIMQRGKLQAYLLPGYITRAETSIIDYSLNKNEGMVGMKMPEKYVVEMVMDRIAACMVYMGDDYTDRSPLEYYEKGKGRYLMHPETMELLEKLLTMLADKGEAYTFDYIRKQVLHNK